MASRCLDLCTNTITIDNNNYIFNNLTNITEYGLYENSGNNYLFINVPKLNPLGFYIDNCNNTATNDISNLITYVSTKDIIDIYVSSGSDLSYNNNDFFRFYDASNNLININFDPASEENLDDIDDDLTDICDNFYFMRNVRYRFISKYDFSASSPFGISGDSLSNLQIDLYKLTQPDSSFIIDISNADNTNNKLFLW